MKPKCKSAPLLQNSFEFLFNSEEMKIEKKYNLRIVIKMISPA